MEERQNLKEMRQNFEGRQKWVGWGWGGGQKIQIEAKMRKKTELFCNFFQNLEKLGVKTQ